MSSHLSKEDVQRLIEEPSATVRAEVATKLARDIENPVLSESELVLAYEVVRLMAKDVESSVRQALSENLRHAARLPHDVAVQLANDIESVALPILKESEVLTEKDLLEIISKGSANKQEAIATRAIVTPAISDALITQAGEKAVTKLMENIGAQISDTSYGKAIERFNSSEAVKEAMVKRPQLPITVAEHLTSIVSNQLRDYLVSHHELSPSVAADLVLQSRERTIVEMVSGSTEQEMEKLVGQMNSHGRLTPSIVLRALCMGDVLFFEAALASLANIPLLNARILIHDGGKLGLKTLYERAQMPPSMFSVVTAALDVVHETEMDGEKGDLPRYRARVIERVLTRFEDVGSDDFDYLITKLGDILSHEKMA
ncbi:MAG: DUF2336 domain-containing protein [Proteobacteria bacterium]|nr:DUF2336 domain-containing protein [Pseudomonadota bacterium]